MSRKVSFITIIGAALVLAAPAYGEPRPDAPQWHNALMARSEGMNAANGLGVQVSQFSQSSQGLTDRSADAVVVQSGAQASRGLTDRSADAIVGQSGEQSSIAALELRSEALNKQYSLGRYATAPSAMDRLIAREAAFEPQVFPPDAVERAVIASTRGTGPGVVVDRSVETSGREFEWPQVGIGLGIALLFGLGLALAIRHTRVRTLAH